MPDDRKLNKVAMATLLVYFIDTALDGTGRLVDFGYVSLRMILFAVACIATLYPLIKKFRRTMLNPCVLAAVIFGAVALIYAFIGLKRGYGFDNVREDFTSVMALALLPGTIATIDSREKLNKVLNVLFICALILATVFSLLYMVAPFAPEATEKLNEFLTRKIGNCAVTKTRVYYRTGIFMITGILIGLNKLKEAEGRNVLRLYLAEGLLVFGILLPVARSFWLGLAVALFIVLLLRPRDIVFYLRSGTAALIVALALVGLASLCWGEFVLLPEVIGRTVETAVTEKVDYSSLAETETGVPLDEQNVDMGDVIEEYGSDGLRNVMVSRLKYNIKKYFWTGAGLGKGIAGEGSGGKNEHMYLDFLMKLGIFGFLTFLAAYFTPVFIGLKRMLSELRTANSELAPVTCHLSPVTLYLLAGYLGIAAASYFNPYLTNPMGIMILSILAAAVSLGDG